jgi:hypothetical protein
MSNLLIPNLSQINSMYLTKYNTGLGNALFQIFSCYGLSKKYNKLFCNNNIKYLIHKLENNFKLNHKNTIFRNLQIYYNDDNITHSVCEDDNLYSSVDNNIINFIEKHNNCNILINGYMQSHKYFDDYYDEICQLISPDKDSYNYIHNKYPHLFDNNNVNISVHIRMNWLHNIKYNDNYNYFYNAIMYIKKIVKNKKCIINIFSDDIPEVKKKFNCNEDVVYYNDNYDYIDLWCMSLCNHNILSNSTLSWWGAYINKNENKIVIYPKDILRLHKATIYNEYKHIERIYEHYEPEWICLECDNVIFDTNYIK